MENNRDLPLTATDVLQRYTEEDLPEFCELALTDVNQRGNFGNYPIHVAAIRGALDELAALVAGGARVNARGEQGNTPLHEAAGQGHVEAVRFLLQCGALRSVKNGVGLTPLDVAKMSRRDEIARLLMA